MSAGTGITHSEFNPSAIEDLHFFQIWILPEKRNIKPRYAQKNFKNLFQKNEFIQLVGSEQSGEYLTINQDAYISRAIVDKEKDEWQVCSVDGSCPKDWKEAIDTMLGKTTFDPCPDED